MGWGRGGRKGWLGKGWVGMHWSWLGGPGGQGGGARARQGVQGLRFRGVGGRGTGPRDGAAGVPTGAGLVDGGVDQGP